MRRITCCLVMVVCLLTCQAQAATRLIYENFDDQAIDSHFTIYGNNWATMSPPQYNLTTSGRGGAGYCFASGTLATPYLCYENSVPNPWPSNEMYCSWYMRYPTWVQNHTNENVKFFYPHWNGTNNAFELARTTETGAFYCIYRDGGAAAGGSFSLSEQNDTNIAPFASEASEFNIGNSTYIGQTVTTFMDSITIWSAYK